MNPIIIISISVLIFLILLILLIKASKEVSRLTNKYSSIIDIEAERDKIEKEAKWFSDKLEKMRLEFKTRVESFSAKYDKANQLYEKLQKEISKLEESLDILECGIYKPHFDFGTSEEYRQQLEILNNEEKEMVKANKAIICPVFNLISIGGSKADGLKMTKQIHKIMLRAFNGECDAAVSKVRWDNVVKMEERIRKSFEVINKTGEPTQSHITDQYLELKLKELRLTFEYQEKIKRERDEQRQIQEEMREEEKARKEIERAKEDAEKEEERYRKALEKAREEAEKTSGEKLEKMNEKVQQLESQLKEAQEMKARAISRAQITKSGHVYIISNIGSFGENVYKIGMTRRLEPLDRVKELGDASVPFSFDVHALVYSENAPELEAKMHEHFETKRVNLINERKEFFGISIDDIEKWAKEMGVDLKLTKLAEAREYRESLALRSKGEEVIKKAAHEEIPLSVDDIFSKEE